MAHGADAEHQHRFSKDIVFSVSDPQYVTSFSPGFKRLCRGPKLRGYDEQSQYVKLDYPEGEIDFVASPVISSNPFSVELILGVRCGVGTPLEIVAKKIRYRADSFKARDIYDLALGAEATSRICAARVVTFEPSNATLCLTGWKNTVTRCARISPKSTPSHLRQRTTIAWGCCCAT